MSVKKMEPINSWLQQAEPPIRKKKEKRKKEEKKKKNNNEYISAGRSPGCP